jgi:hypothetical protein
VLGAVVTVCVCGCGKRAVHEHHAVYAQHINRAGGNAGDIRNLVPMAFGCHEAHHKRARVLELRVLPDSVFTFAAELYGREGAWSYLRRYYAGEDWRLDELLEEAA